MSVRLPLDGSILLCEAVELRLQKNPDSDVYVFSRDARAEDDVTESIKWLEFSRACHRMAHRFSTSSRGAEKVVAILADADIVTYQAVLVGLMKAGFTPFPISPFTLPAGIISLLRQTNCHRLVATQDCSGALIEGLDSEYFKSSPGFELEIIEFPSIGEIYPRLARESVEDPFEPYHQVLPSPSPTDIAIYIHSSGSTGLPKAISLTHQVILSWAKMCKMPSYHFPSNMRDQPDEVSQALLPNDGQYLLPSFTFPPFGGLGLVYQVIIPTFTGLPVSTFPPIRTSTTRALSPSAENVLKYLRRYPTGYILVLPTLLQTWSQDKDALRFLRSLKHVAYGGCPILPSVAQTLVDAGVNLFMSYGATEVGPVTLCEPRKAARDDWEYVEFHDLVDMRWSRNDDGTYEACILSTEQYSPAVINTADKTGYQLSDLFAKHPTKEGLWRVLGRKDDFFVDAKGRNIVPGPVEAIVTGCPLVRHALMLGQNRTQTGILIDLAGDDRNTENHIGKIWPWIEKANATVQSFAKIDRNMILFSSPHKPLPVTIKGLVRRNDAALLYASEINSLYAQRDAGGAGHEFAKL